jgi:translation initiation factor IF-3
MQVLERRAKLKAFVFFKGRSIIYKDQGQILLLRLATDLENLKWKLCQFWKEENDYVHCSEEEK